MEISFLFDELSQIWDANPKKNRSKPGFEAPAPVE
jgi:hypothetical protein